MYDTIPLRNSKNIPLPTLEELTADKKDEVETYVKENKLKVKKENDFVKAIIFYRFSKLK